MKNKVGGLLWKKPLETIMAVIVVLLVIFGASVLTAVFVNRDNQSHVSFKESPITNKKAYSMQFKTLGTMGGPIASTKRSQPAYVLSDANNAILIDSGDGVVKQLAKAGVPLKSIQTIIISHLHIDHTGGLFTLIGSRIQMSIPGELTIYGPTGTKQMVDGFIDATRPIMYGSTTIHIANIKVIEITDGSKFKVGPVMVTAATNTHYGFKTGSTNALRFQSLSYRFDMPDRSIVFTGDTGPSSNVEHLAHNADLLVSEIIDVDDELAKVKKERPDLPFYAKPFLKMHFAKQHLTEKEVGLLAQRSGAKALVLTHNSFDSKLIESAGRIVASNYKGPITFANDLDNY